MEIKAYGWVNSSENASEEKKRVHHLMTKVKSSDWTEEDKEVLIKNGLTLP